MTTASSYVPNNRRNDVSVKVAGSIEEMMQAFTIRSAVFMADQNCPYAEEFDGNDFSATHVVAYEGESRSLAYEFAISATLPSSNASRCVKNTGA